VPTFAEWPHRRAGPADEDERRVAGRYPQSALEEFAQLAEECSICYQCGTCTSACPSARDLYRGPRRLVRLVLAGEIDAVLDSDDLWRCTECGTCTSVCRMEIDVASILGRLRALERAHGRLRCPERSAAEIAAKRLERHPRIDNMTFGATMAARGHVPRDVVGAAEAGMKIARQWLPGGKRVAGGASPARPGANAAAEPAITLPFYAGCALPQDGQLHALVHEVAAGFGVRLDEAADAGCCGHPSRGAVPSLFASDARVCTACPACDASLAEASIEAIPLWDALTDRARREGFALRARSGAFVPYVGCLADRDQALAALADAAALAGIDVHVAYPSLHNACCGALGGMYRGATKGSRRLLEFAAERRAPIVTTCALCRDNVRSAARQLRLDVPVYFWPEFFRAAERHPEEASHA
jgi:heterodisulfide reductase subunit C